MGQYRGYNDQWIAENIGKYPSWKKLFEEYYSIFRFGNYRNFRNHLYNDLKYTRKFTEEQDRWIKENYPKLGRQKAAEEFGKTFPCGRSAGVIATRGMQLGVTVSENAMNTLRKKATVKRPVGSKAIRTNSKGVSSVWVKLPTGEWKRESHINIGSIPDGMIIAHLDCDFTNNDPQNLIAITKSQSALMTAHKFWSENPAITKTGVVCTNLIEAHKKATLEAATPRVAEEQRVPSK